MLILGIETSCDETAVAIVEDGKKVLVNLIASSIQQHQKYGGIVPEIAARDQIKQILPLLEKAFQESKLTWEGIDKIAVTENPGLVSSLLIGINTAQTLAWLKQKPLIKVNHIHGHIYANWLERETEPVFPIMVLTVSGGHNELMLLHSHGNFELIGETLDDSAGEAFDKVAKMLELGYPGGPIISKLAEKGDLKAYKFPRALNQNENFDFSFSGLKTAVLYTLRDLQENMIPPACSVCGKKGAQGVFPEKIKADICASFQEAVCEILSKKLIKSAEKFQVKEIHLAGGVSANQRLRQLVQTNIANSPILKGVKFRFPEKIEYCTDNASMIASAGYWRTANG